MFGSLGPKFGRRNNDEQFNHNQGFINNFLIGDLMRDISSSDPRASKHESLELGGQWNNQNEENMLNSKWKPSICSLVKI
jgi:hypothetical protein